MPLYFTSNIITVLSIIHFLCIHFIGNENFFSLLCCIFLSECSLSFLLHWSLFICNFKGIWTFYLKTLVVFNDAIVFCDVVVHVYVYVKVDYPNFRILEVVWWIYILECTSYQCVEIFLTVLVIHLCTKLNILPVCLKTCRSLCFGFHRCEHVSV